MARRRLPRAASAAVENFALAQGEIVHDTTLNRPRFGDGATPGGHMPIMDSEGARAIRVYGDGIDFDPLDYEFTGLQGALGGIMFRGDNRGAPTREEMLAVVASDPGDLIDDAPRLNQAIQEAIYAGVPLIMREPLFIATGQNLQAEGKRLHLIGRENAWLIGGPARVGPMIQVSNITTVGTTEPRSIDAIVEGLNFDNRHTPGGVLSSTDCMNLNSFRRTRLFHSEFYANDHYLTSAKGDAGFGVRGNDVLVGWCSFTGTQDAGIYITADPTGLLDNFNALFIGNSYKNSRGAWAAKREYEHIKSVGEYVDGCYNGFSTAPGGAINDARKISVSAAQFRNMIMRCIDLRGCDNSNINGIEIGGTFGVMPNGSSPGNANAIQLAGSRNNRIDFVFQPTNKAATAKAIQLIADTDNRSGAARVSSNNVISGTVENVATALNEGADCDNNDIKLKLINVDSAGTTSGGKTQYRYDLDGERFYLVGGADRMEGRTRFGAVRTTTTTLTLTDVGPDGRIIPVQTFGSPYSVFLPAGAKPATRVGFLMVEGSTGGTVSVRDPANTTTLARLDGPGDAVWLVHQGGDVWYPDGSHRVDRRRPFTGTALTATTTLSRTVYNWRSVTCQPGASSIDILLWAGFNGDEVTPHKQVGSGAGAVLVKTPGGVTLHTLTNVGDTVTLRCSDTGAWLPVSAYP